MQGRSIIVCVVLLVAGLVVGSGLGYYAAPPKIVERQVAVGVEVGKSAPQFSLPSTLGRQVSLSEFRGKWVVLFFYPAAYTPICKSEVEEFNRRLNEFKQLDTEVLGASVDDVATLTKWSAEIGGIDYPLLSDTGGPDEPEIRVIYTGFNSRPHQRQSRVDARHVHRRSPRYSEIRSHSR